jgi:8-oxo-dGTP diphosphatase
VSRRGAPRVGVGGVLVRAGRVLLVRRGKAPLLGRWTIPGGTVEHGEELATALRREMEEETSLRVEPREILAVLDRIDRQGGRILYHYVIVDYLCGWVSGEARAGSDAREIAWVGERDLPAYGLTPEALAVVREAFRRRRPATTSGRASSRRPRPKAKPRARGGR